MCDYIWVSQGELFAGIGSEEIPDGEGGLAKV